MKVRYVGKDEYVVVGYIIAAPRVELSMICEPSVYTYLPGSRLRGCGRRWCGGFAGGGVDRDKGTVLCLVDLLIWIKYCLHAYRAARIAEGP